MSVHVVPEVAAELHLLTIACWCVPTVEQCGEALVSHHHRDDRPTRWLMITMGDPEPN